MKSRIVVLIMSFAILFSSLSPVCKGLDDAVQNDYEGAMQAVFSAWDNFEETVDVSEFNIDEDNRAIFREYVLKNNTEYFYVEFKSYVCVDGMIDSINFEYAWSKEETQEKIIKFNKKVEEVLNLIPENVTDAEKLLILHDYIALNTDYVTEVYSDPDYDDGLIRTAYGCLVNERAVCQGISNAFLYLCKKIGIEAYIVTSDKMGHEWNMVKLGDNYYHIDITQDHPVYYLGKYGYHQAHGDIFHTFFLKSDLEISNGVLGDSAHYAWVAPHSATDNETFKNAFWNSAYGAVNYINGEYYYIADNHLTKYNYNTKKTTQLFGLTNEVWDCSCGTLHRWKSAYSKSTVDVKNNFVYFICGNHIHSYNISNGSVSVIYSRYGKGFIYSVFYKNNKLEVSVRDDEKGKNYAVDQTDINPFYVDLSVTLNLPDSSVLTGDVDGDGDIGVSDILIIRKYSLGLINEINTASADVKVDKIIDMKDILFLKKLLAHR